MRRTAGVDAHADGTVRVSAHGTGVTPGVEAGTDGTGLTPGRVAYGDSKRLTPAADMDTDGAGLATEVHVNAGTAG